MKNSKCNMKIAALFFIAALSVFGIEAQTRTNDGLAAYYREYLPLVERQKGLHAAEVFLLRSQDWAQDSSDLSYELARVQDALKRPRRDVLASLNKAVAVDRWEDRSRSEAILFKARILNELCEYSETLAVLETIPSGVERELYALKAFLGLKRSKEFKKRISSALVRYPDMFLEMVFRYADKLGSSVNEDDRRLVEAAVERVLRLGPDSDLIFYAAPYIYDTDAARRQLKARCAALNGKPPFEAIPVLLNLGVINEDMATEILFVKDSVLPVHIVRSIYALLRTEPARERYLKELSSWTGIIAEDLNGDGIFDTNAEYKNGILIRWTSDVKQERENPFVMEFRAETPVSIDYSHVHLSYESYPAVKLAIAGPVRYYFVPGSFFYTPANFERLCSSDGPLFPTPNTNAATPNDRMLYLNAFIIERPGLEFENSVEELRLASGVPLSAVERISGRRVSETIYENGRPVYQRVDMDTDGKMETTRRFARSGRAERVIESVEVEE